MGRVVWLAGCDRAGVPAKPRPAPIRLPIRPLARTPARTPASISLGTLSQREIEVLALLADKTSTREIASTLSISIRTVRTHIQHLMYKLQVHKRLDAIEVGKRYKLI